VVEAPVDGGLCCTPARSTLGRAYGSSPRRSLRFPLATKSAQAPRSHISSACRSFPVNSPNRAPTLSQPQRLSEAGSNDIPLLLRVWGRRPALQRALAEFRGTQAESDGESLRARPPIHQHCSTDIADRESARHPLLLQCTHARIGRSLPPVQPSEIQHRLLTYPYRTDGETPASIA